MNRIVPVLVAASLAASGAALAQSTPNNNGLTTGIVPGTSSGAVTPGTGPSAAPVVGGAAAGIAPRGTPPTVGGTSMGEGMAPGAIPTMEGNQRQTNAGAPTNGGATVDTRNRMSQTPAPGANSFTVGQARARIQHDGFTQVNRLHKDRQGIWRGKAMKDGESVNVALDYQGHVVGQ